MKIYQNISTSQFIAFLLLVLSFDVSITASQAAKYSDFSIQTPQPIPVPTAINYDLLPVVETLLLDNSGCDLPCWWGFQVGEAEEADWITFLLQQGLVTAQEIEFDQDGRIDDTGGNLLYALGSWYADFNLVYAFKNQTLNALQISFVNPNEWLSKEIRTITLPGLLGQLEEIPAVYFTTDNLGQWSLDQLEIWIISEESGLAASYTLDLSKRQSNPELNDGDSLNLCLGLSEITRITLYLENINDLEQVRGISSRIVSNSRYHTPDEIFGISNESFVEFFQNNPDECLHTSLSSAQADETTHTPIPTISITSTPYNYDSVPIFEELLQTNEGCELPCWWGFEIGNAKDEDWVAFLEQQELVNASAILTPSESSPSREGSGNIIYALGTWAADTQISYGVRGGILRYLRVTFYDPFNWLSPDIQRITLPGVLSQLNKTPEIYLFTDDIGQWGFNDIDFQLIDDELGFMVRYTIDVSQRQTRPLEAYSDYGETLNLCLGITETKNIQMTIQDPETEGAVSRRVPGAENNPRYHTIEETLGVDTDTFVQFFIENPDGCLEVQYLKPE
jgi:hypothetical protein